MEALLTLYVVKNSDGQYFRGGGYGLTWVSEIENDKIYTKLSQAKSRVTFFAKNYKDDHPAPEILELNATLGKIINQEERLKNLAKQKEERQKIKKLKAKQEELKNLERQFEDLKKKLGK